MKEVKLETIKITVGDTVLELSVEEAKELKYVLDKLFEKDKEYITIPPNPIQPWNPTYPWVDGEGTGTLYPNSPDVIYCSTDNNIKVEV